MRDYIDVTGKNEDEAISKALAQLGLVPPLIATVLYAFLSIRLEDASILDFLRYAMCFLFLKQQYFEWRENET